ncbi:MAG: hypothetical protein GOVbin1782_63 [Prokaryotic dsDNA virus sp.]|nr:MAG: hypothetical protein GOVbin1782_63 [Prokaryotic dsDNA virus sp.]|tara:strand:+ start:1503 stop:2165 length:663 start_codon:yes stop_codon:yes gene_type:complete
MAKTRKHCKLCQHPDRDQLEERLSSKQVTPDELDEEMGWTSGVSARHLRNHMDTDYTDQSNPKCALCVSPERKVLEMAIHEGEISPSTVAADLGISRQQVMKHMNKHLKPLVQQSAAMEIMKRDLNEIDLLSVNIHRLEEKIELLFAEDDLNPKYIDSLTKLAKEIRESLKYMLEFKGQLVHKRQDTIIVHQMQVVQEVLAQQHPQVWLDIKKQMQEKLQ